MVFFIFGVIFTIGNIFSIWRFLQFGIFFHDLVYFLQFGIHIFTIWYIYYDLVPKNLANSLLFLVTVRADTSRYFWVDAGTKKDGI